MKKKEDTYIDGSEPDHRAKRLDYIFFGGDAEGPASQWSIDSVNVGATERHPTLLCSLSDHFSVETTLTRSNHPTNTLPQSTTVLPIETYDQILAMVHKYDARERKQRRYRLYHFGLEIVIAISCFIAVWWSPRNFVAFLLMLLSTLGLSAGVIDGLMGGLFVGSELRALREFEWEITNARNMALAAQEALLK